ncbi:MAG: hypothetical protein L3J23_09985 [Flavobacteriaceae bacterium]|nr:hypothetical protein [Flavobacteriaceae bacterium]
MRYLLLIVLIIISFNQTFSQEEDVKNKSSFWQNVQFGGGINVGFGNNTNLGISPTAIYNFNKRFSAGLGISYLYVKNRNFDNALNVYGGSLIALFNALEEIQLSTEFETTILSQSGFESRNVNALHLGAAYNIGRNITIGMRYDVLYDANTSIYGSAFTPIIRAFF